MHIQIRGRGRCMCMYMWGVAQQLFYNLHVDVLERWEVPPINEVNRKLKKIEISLKRQEESIDEVRFVLKLTINTLHACAM